MSDEARIVLGDELLMTGEPRLVALGELVAVQSALRKTPVDHELLARERLLLRDNEVRWFGELAPGLRREGRVHLGWRLGFLDRVVLRTESPRFCHDLTVSPPARFLRSVLIDLRDRRPEEPGPFDAPIAELATPLLEELELRPHASARAPLRTVAEHVKRWPHLTKLTLWLRAGEDDLPAVLDGCPNLRHLTLRGASNRTARILAASAVLSRLDTLDLEHGSVDTIDDPARWARLGSLRLHGNRLSEDRVRALGAELRDRVTFGTQHPASEVAARRARFEQAIRRIAEEQSKDDAWESEFTPSPYFPDRIVGSELAVPEAVPFLMERLDVEPPERRWIELALTVLGERAIAASDALMDRRRLPVVLAVDPERGRANRVDRVRGIRSWVCRLLSAKPEELVRHLRGFLDDADPEIVAFALDTNDTDRSLLADLAREHPEVAPVGHLRVLLSHDDPAIHRLAAGRLANLHLPEDVERVLAHLASGREVAAGFASWLGSHDDSDRALSNDTLRLDEIFHIVRRRRGAGLATDVELVRERVRRAIEGRHGTRGQRDRDLEYATKILRELRVTDPTPFGLASLDPVLVHGEWPVEPTLDTADDLFLRGWVDDPTLIDSGAFGHYVELLWADPACGPAAFQLAWIDRSYGSVITGRRQDWLRSLGVARDLVEALGRPPKRILAGYGPGFDRAHHAPDPERAQMALDAELPCVAANYFPFESEAALSARRAAEEHVARVRAITRA